MGRTARIPDCHPDLPHHADGVCKRCYKREWFRQYRKRAKCAEPGCKRAVHAREVCQRHYYARYQAITPKGPGKQYGSVYPQEIVRVGIKGWGCV